VNEKSEFHDFYLDLKTNTIDVSHFTMLWDKIAKAKQAYQSKKSQDSEKSEEYKPADSQIKSVKTENSKSKRRQRIPGSFVTSERDRSTKNIVKNYGKAICSFGCSDIAKPYLEPILEKEKVQQKQFQEFISKVKESIDSIQSFRALLLIRDDDTSDVVAFKRVFASIGEIFIKYFSVNWIFSGRITHKDAHLKFRFKMLRRIKHPEFFTYLKQGHEKNI